MTCPGCTISWSQSRACHGVGDGAGSLAGPSAATLRAHLSATEAALPAGYAAGATGLCPRDLSRSGGSPSAVVRQQPRGARGASPGSVSSRADPDGCRDEKQSGVTGAGGGEAGNCSMGTECPLGKVERAVDGRWWWPHRWEWASGHWAVHRGTVHVTGFTLRGLDHSNEGGPETPCPATPAPPLP